MMGGNLEGWSTSKEIGNVLKWRSGTLDKSAIINSKILEAKIRQQNSNYEMTPGSKEASCWQMDGQTFSGWVDDKEAET